MQETFPSGLVVRWQPLPEGFDPLKASEQELVMHGFPPRPKDPRLLSQWEKVTHRLASMSFTEPQLFRTNRRHLPAIRDGTGNSTNWSGGVVYLPAGFAVAKFFIVYGQWTVPNPFPAAGDFQLYHCSFWIGIDGSYSSDVLQAGAHCEAQNTSSGIVQREIHPWFEWFPENEIQITNLTVSAGDILSCLISSTSSTTANMILANSTTNRAVAVETTAPGTTKLDGNCAAFPAEL